MTTQGNIATTNVLAPRPRDLASATPSATAAYFGWQPEAVANFWIADPTSPPAREIGSDDLSSLTIAIFLIYL
jgi:hypothetical protein